MARKLCALRVEAAPAKLVRFVSAGASSLLVLIQVTPRGRKGYEFGRQRCANYTAIYCTVFKVSMCSIYCPAVAYRPFDTGNSGLSWCFGNVSAMAPVRNQPLKG